jgi:hypothetical protein
MNNPYIKAIFKIICCVLALFSVLWVAIYGTQLSKPIDDNYYAALLVVAIIYLHWFSWKLYFDFIGLPKSEINLISGAKISHRSSWRVITGLGYMMLITTIFIHYSSVDEKSTIKGIDYALILLISGLLGEIAYVTKHLIKKKYTDE